MLTKIRQILEMIRFSHTIFALRHPGRVVRAVWATENAERKLADALAERAASVQRATPRPLARLKILN